MNTFAKFALAPAAAALSFAVLSPAVSAGEKESIVVSGATMEQFRSDTSRKLDQRLALAERVTRMTPQSGIVQIRFTLDDRGMPTNLKTVSNTGGHSAGRMARWAVARLSGLDEAPVANAADATFQANIVFADDQDERNQLFAALRTSTRLAQASSDEPVVMLGL